VSFCRPLVILRIPLSTCNNTQYNQYTHNNTRFDERYVVAHIWLRVHMYACSACCTDTLCSYTASLHILILSYHQYDNTEMHSTQTLHTTVCNACPYNSKSCYTSRRYLETTSTHLASNLSCVVNSHLSSRLKHLTDLRQWHT
jgi:hypothetical protein